MRIRNQRRTVNEIQEDGRLLRKVKLALTKPNGPQLLRKARFSGSQNATILKNEV
jgi:hypothetical protein